MSHHFRILAAALSGALIISFSAIWFALSEVSPVTGALFRVAYAIPVLGLIWFIRRRSDQRPRSRRALALGAGLALGADFVAWHSAIEAIGAGLATLIANTSVVFVALGAWLILGERPRRTTLLMIPVILSGVAMVSGLGQGDAFGRNPLAGTVLALVAAVFYATFLLGYRHSNESQAPGAGPLLEASIGALIAPAVVGVLRGDLDLSFSWPAHGWLIALALGAQVVGWLLIGYALPRLPAVETATIILVQPAVTLLWAFIIFAEQPSPLQILGVLVVLTGVGIVSWTRATISRGDDDHHQPTGGTINHGDPDSVGITGA